MLGEFIIKILVMVLGYLYPAVECFKTIERSRHRPDVERLMFWCQYWIIIAMLTALEKFGDIFVSWVPLYAESKLTFIVYLWHPKTKGTSYVYNTILRPFMAEHETDIEKRLQSMLTKSIDLLLFYIRHFTEQGQFIAFEILQRFISRPPRLSSTPEIQKQPASPSPKPSKGLSLFPKIKSPKKNKQNKKDEAALDGDEIHLKKIEDAFRAAGVNLREISSPTRRRQ